VIINRDSKPWITASLIILAIAGVLYIPYSRSASGPSGGSQPGLIYGAVGSAMMLFALLLNARKKKPTMRVGRLYTWMQGHVWLGLLSYPMILFHAGFSLGGPLTTILMILFTVIVISGVAGLALQQVIPRIMLEQLPMESIYEQIDHVLDQLRKEADDLVNAIVEKNTAEAFVMEVASARPKTVTIPTEKTPADAALRDFYLQEVKPFLHDQARAEGKLSTRQNAENVFDQIRKILPPELHQQLEDLQLMVEERRQLLRQVRLHHLLHGWLLVHVPLSFALLVLAAVHAVAALRYT
jgi:hypothetical protein